MCLKSVFLSQREVTFYVVAQGMSWLKDGSVTAHPCCSTSFLPFPLLTLSLRLIISNPVVAWSSRHVSCGCLLRKQPHCESPARQDIGNHTSSQLMHLAGAHALALRSREAAEKHLSHVATFWWSQVRQKGKAEEYGVARRRLSTRYSGTPHSPKPRPPQHGRRHPENWTDHQKHTGALESSSRK